jgi:hypothetical protein
VPTGILVRLLFIILNLKVYRVTKNICLEKPSYKHNGLKDLNNFFIFLYGILIQLLCFWMLSI